MLQQTLDPVWHMWFVGLVLVGACIAFVRERQPPEVIAFVVLTVLLLWGVAFPIKNDGGSNLLGLDNLLKGFGNPALISIMGFLVIGQGLVQTDAVRLMSRALVMKKQGYAHVALYGFLLFSLVLSAFMNNIPQIVVAIPIVQMLAAKADIPDSKILMPLNFAVILGGMFVLVGSSNNLLINGTAQNVGVDPIGMFEFTVPALAMVIIGYIYSITIVPRLLPDNRIFKADDGENKHYVAEFRLNANDPLIGQECENGRFPKIKDVRVRLIKRNERVLLPPFEGEVLLEGDTIICTGEKENILHTVSGYGGRLVAVADNAPASATTSEDEYVLAELMIPPGSQLLDIPATSAAREISPNIHVLGVKRRSSFMLTSLREMRLRAGDTILVSSLRSHIDLLGANKNFVILSGSKAEVPIPKRAPLSTAIFLTVVLAASFDLLPFEIAAMLGAVSMVITGCLNMRQAGRALNLQVYMLAASLLGLGEAVKASGLVTEGVDVILSYEIFNDPFWLSSAMFAIVMVVTNMISGKAAAILFTPMMVALAMQLNVDPKAFLFALMMAANCSFATPIGYQTNLLIMGPGDYKFMDYVRTGTPLCLLMLVIYMALAKFYFAL